MDGEKKLIALGSIFLGGALSAIYLSQKRQKNQKKFDLLFAEPPPLGKIQPCSIDDTRIGYKKNLPSECDVVIIGAGTSGLIAASLLTQLGKKVVVLEQHDRAGGSLHTFDEHGFSWDTGVHYIGRLGMRTDMSRVILDACSNGQVEWSCNGDIYDEIRLGENISVSVKKSERGFVEAFSKAFPGHEEDIRKYLSECKKARGATVDYILDRKIASQNSLFGNLLWRFARFLKSPWRVFEKVNKTVDQVFDELKITNKELRAALTYSWGDIGEPPSMASFFIQAQLTLHYLEGAYYPVGGSMMIPRHILNVIHKGKSQVLVRAPVSSIVVHENQVKGVSLSDGTFLSSPIVISTAGVHNTFGKLLDQNQISAKYLDMIQKHKPSLGSTHVSLYVGLKGNSKENNLPKNQMWTFPDADHDKNIKTCLEHPLDKLGMFFISFPSAKDPIYDHEHPDNDDGDKKGKSKDAANRCNTSTAEVLSLAPYSLFEPFKNDRVKHRSNEYIDMKNKMADQMFKELFKRFPQLKDKVEYFEVGTPITTEYYLGSVGGASYGLEHTPSRFRDVLLSPKTEINGLFLSGQDTFSVGVASCIVSGALTVDEVVGGGLMEAVIREMKRRKRV